MDECTGSNQLLGSCEQKFPQSYHLPLSDFTELYWMCCPRPKNSTWTGRPEDCRQILCLKKHWRTPLPSALPKLQSTCATSPLYLIPSYIKYYRAYSTPLASPKFPMLNRSTQICTVAQHQDAEKSTVPALFGKLCKNRREGERPRHNCMLQSSIGSCRIQ